MNKDKSFPFSGPSDTFILRLVDYIDPLIPEWSKKVEGIETSELMKWLDLAGIKDLKQVPDPYLQFAKKLGRNNGGMLQSLNASFEVPMIMEAHKESGWSEVKDHLCLMIGILDTGDDLCMMLSGSHKGEIWSSSGGESVDFVASNFESLVMRGVFETVEEIAQSHRRTYSASPRVMHDLGVRSDWLEFYSQKLEQTGVTLLWFSDDWHRYFVFEGGVLFLEKPSHGGVMLTFMGQTQEVIEEKARWLCPALGVEPARMEWWQ